MKTSIPKMSAMITSAIRHLRQSQGSTSKEIMNYIISRYNLESPELRQMQAALKRGLNSGILDKNRGQYKLNAMAEYILQLGRDELEDKSGRRQAKMHRRSAKGKKRKYRNFRGSKGRSSTRSTSRERCRCFVRRGKNPYTLESDIPPERHERRHKDVICCFKKNWKEKCDNESTDQSRSTLVSNSDIIDDRGKI